MRISLSFQGIVSYSVWAEYLKAAPDFVRERSKFQTFFHGLLSHGMGDLVAEQAVLTLEQVKKLEAQVGMLFRRSLLLWMLSKEAPLWAMVHGPQWSLFGQHLAFVTSYRFHLLYGAMWSTGGLWSGLCAHLCLKKDLQTSENC